MADTPRRQLDGADTPFKKTGAAPLLLAISSPFFNSFAFGALSKVYTCE